MPVVMCIILTVMVHLATLTAAAPRYCKLYQVQETFASLRLALSFKRRMEIHAALHQRYAHQTDDIRAPRKYDRAA